MTSTSAFQATDVHAGGTDRTLVLKQYYGRGGSGVLSGPSKSVRLLSSLGVSRRGPR